ncbi:hypothetical protein [Myxococcus sp. SDU36]|uniref:hypothetical protein n=1 Tax=Myxococcus sp. SDU36 TaxID=2831967 RepID=UPI002543BBA2|nr:hypothetical protein [Myxococcus sp. SDU36]WIG95724.1 hypothetical protein KGD87_35610 [Myxococcus sp. SDU36]
MKTTLTRNTLLGSLMTLMLTACGEDTVKVKGRVTDTYGQQQQGLGEGTPALGGEGTVAAASRVKASSVGSGGNLTVLAEASLEANGAYTLELPPDSKRVVLEAVDGSGKVVASALLDATPEGQDSRTAPPMSSESSLEAEVFVRMVKDGASVESVDTVDLRSRINTEMARAVAAESDARAQETVGTLATAVRAAQEAEVQAYAEAGFTTSQDALFNASLQASAALDAALDTGTKSAADTYAEFFAALRAATPELDEEEEAEGERAASAAFRATVEARLSTAGSAATADAAIRSAASLEAYAAEAAVEAILQGANATDTTLAKARTAAGSLRASLASATNASAAAQAWASYSVALASSSNVSASVLGTHLGVNASNEAALRGSIDAATQASAALDSSLGLAVELAGVAGNINTTALANTVVNAFSTYHTAVRAQAQALSQFGANAAPAAELLIIAEGSFLLN